MCIINLNVFSNISSTRKILALYWAQTWVISAREQVLLFLSGHNSLCESVNNIFFSEHRNYTGIKAVVAGWGRTDESKAPSNELRKVQVPILSLEDCRQNSGYVSSRITDNMMCAGYHEGQKDSCQVRKGSNYKK